MTENDQDVIEIAESTMLGDLMALCVDEMKAMPDVWQKLPEETQRDLIERTRRRVTDAIAQAVKIVASGDQKTIVATVEKVEFKDGVKATLSMSRYSQSVHDLADATGGTVLIVLEETEGYQGGSEQVQSDPDQPGLGLDEEAA